MYTIEKQDDNAFLLMKDGIYVAGFPTLDEAEQGKAKWESADAEYAAACKTGTWVDDGEGIEYPEGTDDYHSGEETPLTFEERFDAVLRHLADVHGIHLPAHLAPKD